MTMETSDAVPGPRTTSSLYTLTDHVNKRNAKEARFKAIGIGAILTGLAFLVILVTQIVGNGASAFQQTRIDVTLTVTQEEFESAEKSSLKTSKYRGFLEDALMATIAESGVETPFTSGRDIRPLISSGAGNTLRQYLLNNEKRIGEEIKFNVLTNGTVDGYLKGRVSRESIVNDKNIDEAHLTLVDTLHEAGVLRKGFNAGFITGNDTSDLRPEQSGFGQSMLGSLAMMIVVLLVCLPISVGASIYLEEFAPKNKITDFIEVNISNLAAVPSIVFGILALAAFIQFGGGTLGIEAFRNSAPLVGGLALSLMTLPTIIIATRASLKAVPGTIREAALGLGASRMQAVFHHILPLAMPGILTGTIIGLAAALGETAPLLMIGMVAFVQMDISSLGGFFTDPNVGMPAQIYIWATRADGAWYERAWGGIIILLVFLLTMNIIAIILRRRFERRW